MLPLICSAGLRGVVLLYPLHEGVYRVQHIVALDESAHPVRTRPLHGGGGVDDHQPPHPPGVVRRVRDSVSASHGETHEHEVSEVQRLRDGVEVRPIRLRRVVTVRRPVGVAVAALVQRQDAEPVAHRQRDEVPRVAGLGVPVEQQHGRTVGLSPLQVVEPASVGHDEAVPRYGFNREGGRPPPAPRRIGSCLRCGLSRTFDYTGGRRACQSVACSYACAALRTVASSKALPAN